MRSVFLFSCFIWAGLAAAQAPTPPISEDSLAHWGRQILEAPEFAVRDSANQKFIRELKAFIQTEEGMHRELPTVNNMLRLAPKDQSFALYTWQRPDADYVYTRYGLLAVKTRRGIVVHELVDALDDIEELEYGYHRPEKWPGALYYQMIPLSGEKDKYTLLGYAPGKDLHLKIIEVLEVKPSGRVRFGGKHFYLEEFLGKTFRKPPLRLVLRYNAKYSASLRYHSDNKRIIMDHLAPPEPRLNGIYTMYGPDFTYDALTWKEGWWYLEEQVRFDSKQNVPIRPPAPREAPR